MTDAQETTPGPAAAAAVAEDDLDSEADDEARSKLENIKYYASLFLGTVRQSVFSRERYRGGVLPSLILGATRGVS